MPTTSSFQAADLAGNLCLGLGFSLPSVYKSLHVLHSACHHQPSALRYLTRQLWVVFLHFGQGSEERWSLQSADGLIWRWVSKENKAGWLLGAMVSTAPGRPWWLRGIGRRGEICIIQLYMPPVQTALCVSYTCFPWSWEGKQSFWKAIALPGLRPP